MLIVGQTIFHYRILEDLGAGLLTSSQPPVAQLSPVFGDMWALGITRRREPE